MLLCLYLFMHPILSNTAFQRVVFFLLLLLWSYLLLPNVIYCATCKSSLGIPYIILYTPIALLLMAQMIFNSRITWFIIFMLSCTLPGILISLDYSFYTKYKTKVGYHWPFFFTTIAAVIFTLLFILLLYVIRPKKANRP